MNKVLGKGRRKGLELVISLARAYAPGRIQSRRRLAPGRGEGMGKGKRPGARLISTLSSASAVQSMKKP